MSIIKTILGYGAAKSSAKAANQAAQLESEAADKGIAENARQFDITRSYYDPIYQDSRAAAGLYNAALGIPTASGGPSMTGPPGGMDYTGYVEGNPDLKAEFGNVGAQFGGDEAAYGKYHWQNFGQGEGRAAPTMTGGSAGGTAGGQATPPLTQASVISMVNQTPGYQAQLSEGLKSIDRAAPLRGGMYSGRRMKALESEGQKTFGSYYQNWLDRVGGVAGSGTGAASGVTNAGQATTNSNNNLRMTGATALGNGKINAANSWAGFSGFAAGQVDNLGRSLMTGGY